MKDGWTNFSVTAISFTILQSNREASGVLEKEKRDIVVRTSRFQLILSEPISPVMKHGKTPSFCILAGRCGGLYNTGKWNMLRMKRRFYMPIMDGATSPSQYSSASSR
jgi:hypothetical protein